MKRSLDGAKQYAPGTNIHFIQARKALDESGSWRGAKINEIGDGIISLEIDGTVTQFKCADTIRLQDIYTSGRVPLTSEGAPMVLVAKYNVLIIPCADEGATFSENVSINSSVVFLDDGAALFSPTENGAWHLFSIGEAQTYPGF